jgi:hypothetical protein
MSLKTLHDEIKSENCISRKSKILVSVLATVACCLERFPETGLIVGCIAGQSPDELKSFVSGRVYGRHNEGIFCNWSSLGLE